MIIINTMEPHLIHHLQIYLSTWFIIMLGITSHPETSPLTRKIIQIINYIGGIIAISLTFNPNFH